MPRNNEHDANLYLTPGRTTYRMGFDRDIFLPKRRASRIVPAIVTIACVVLIGLMFAWRG